MLYKLIRWSRQARIWLGGNKEREERFFLFKLPRPIDPLEFRERLKSLCFQENLFSHAFRGQIFTVRRLLPNGEQDHLRYYQDGAVTGHREMDYFTHQKEHMDSKNLRKLPAGAIEEIKEALK